MAGQLPRPWFRLGSITRPTTATTTAPVTDQPRPAPARIRPPLIRPAALTEPAEPTTPRPSAKSPPQLPRPASLTPQVKKEASPPPAALTKPVVPSPPATALTKPVVPSPSATALTRPVVPSPSNVQSGGPAAAKPSTPKGRSSSVTGSPTHSESFDKESSKQPSPVPSPSFPKSIPAVPSPYQSPKPKPTASPPSPLVLPPPQLQSVAEPKHETIPQEVERKTVVFQKVMEKPSPPDHHITNYHTHTPGLSKNGKQEAKKHDDKEDRDKDKGVIRAKKGIVSSDDKDSNTRVITMAGENRGAFMEVVLSDKDNNSRHLQIRQSNNNEETTTNNVNDNNPKDNKSKKKSTGTRNVWPMKAFFNNNVQGINNSILMDSKFTHHDPGIHLVFSRMPPSADEEHDGRQQ